MTAKQLSQFRSNLLQWYEQNRRLLPWRQTRDFYPIWISEVMLQQTQVAKVIDYYHRFLDQFPTIEKLAQAELEKVLRAWQGLGYYSRARNLHRAAQILLENFASNLPEDINDFKNLPGVGDYISAAVYSFCRDFPSPAVDGNVKRVFSRLFEIDTPINTSAGEKAIHQVVAETFDASHAGKFNQAMIELGALVCKPKNPRCLDCPVKAFCQASRNSSQENFPRKKSKNPVPEYQIAIGVVMDESRFLLARRNSFGLLGGLWEFPGGKIAPSENPEDACARHLQKKFGLPILVGEQISEIRHTYSHFKIKARVFLCKPVSLKPILRDHDSFVWANLEESQTLPIHSAHLKIIEILKKIVSGAKSGRNYH